MRNRLGRGLWLLCVGMVLVAAVGCGGKEPAAETGGTKTGSASYERAGFQVFQEDGRLWVFREGSEGLAEFQKNGEPAKSVTSIGTGPDGMSIRSVDMETIKAYLAAKS